ncbi:biotin--[acetyl-CoA-carboxylase] ligase [Maribacter aestuarii]|uniref:biotin--[acetyl-CoA-carboxylase] ligase n=1 Tax=Maribacter aestuarii TaxID=1130723 RepID=UPI00248B6D58|nr:biotin--[acetyl-CoA-carboxylase] ligase [Maribacter aestuarii]
MQIIKLSATESTNTFLQRLMRKENLQDFTVVVTENQTRGRGQRDALWESEKGNNLTFSVLKKHLELKTQHQFLISICVSLAVYSLLIELNLPRVKIKWPNDILSGTLKVCGILIENVLNGQEVKSSVIGIGLNVNQTVFPERLRATSIKKELKQELHLETLLQKLIGKLQFFYPK